MPGIAADDLGSTSRTHGKVDRKSWLCVLLFTDSFRTRDLGKIELYIGYIA